MAVRHAWLVLFTAAVGCGDNLALLPGDALPDQSADVDASPPVACVIGDVTQPIELELGYLNPTTAELVPLSNMMPLPITSSAQGGFTMRVGVRARNVGCNLQSATIAMFDTCPGTKLIKVETVFPILLMKSADGWGVPLNLGSYFQLHAGPYTGLTRHLDDVPYEIRLAIEDGGRTAQASLHVVPYCADSDDATRALCECQCNKDYVLGGACPPESSGEPPVCDP
jgi:hypothetical protein